MIMQSESRNGFSFQTPSPQTEASPAINILVVEDDADLLNLLALSVKRLNYNPLLATDGEKALDIFSTESVDLILLDLMLPKVTGSEVCAEVRRHSNVPIMMITALDTSEYVEQMLSLGADEYITKPFQFEVLAARIQALLRRVSWSQNAPLLSQITIGDVSLDAEISMVTIGGRRVKLTDTETALLHLLMHQSGQTVSSAELYERIWGITDMRTSTALETNIRRLRVKLETDPSTPCYIITVKGHGYKFQPERLNASMQDELVENVKKRQPAAEESILVVGDLQLNTYSRALELNGQTIILSEIDFRLLQYMMEHAEQIVDKPTLLSCGWAHNPTAKLSLVPAAIQRLRLKIEDDPRNPRLLITIPHKGYQLVRNAER